MSDMENRDWINDFESLKKVSPNNPFIVPSGYFDDLESRTLSIQRLFALNTVNAEGGFTVPQNYFEELENNVNSTFNIRASVTGEGFIIPENYFSDLEAQIMSRVAVEEVLEGSGNEFAVPDGYFNDLEAQIMSRVAVEEMLEGSGGVFAVPDGYFNDLEAQIMSRVAVEEVLASPIEQFTVPEGYFNKLNESILHKTVYISTNRSAVIRKLVASNAFKYATAACLAFVIGGSILISELAPAANNHKGTFLHKELLNVPTDEIKSYLQLNVDAGDTQQTVITEGTPVDANKLKDALENDIDSIR